MVRPKSHTEVSPATPRDSGSPKEATGHDHSACGEVRRGRCDLPGMTPLSRRPPRTLNILNHLEVSHHYISSLSSIRFTAVNVCRQSFRLVLVIPKLHNDREIYVGVGRNLRQERCGCQVQGQRRRRRQGCAGKGLASSICSQVRNRRLRKSFQPKEAPQGQSR